MVTPLPAVGSHSHAATGGRPLALTAMTTSDVVEYVSDKDPAKTQKPQLIDPKDPSKGEIMSEAVGEGATIFRLKPLDVFLMGYIYDNASTLSGRQGDDMVGIHTRVNQTNIEAVRHGLVGFSNFVDAKGGHVRLSQTKAVVNGREYTTVDDASMQLLGLHLIQELANKIKAISEVSGAAEKN